MPVLGAYTKRSQVTEKHGIGNQWCFFPGDPKVSMEGKVCSYTAHVQTHLPQEQHKSSSFKKHLESQGWGSLVGYHLWGCTESDATEATYQQQQQKKASA